MSNKLTQALAGLKRGFQIAKDIRGHGVRDPIALFRFAVMGATPWPWLWDRLANWPLEVALETTDYCNLRCVMCPVTTLERPRGMMTKELFTEMVDQCAGRGDFLFFPQGFGESMLHPEWAEMLEYAKNKGIQPITLITNGILLNDERVQHILDLKIDSMCFSVDGVSQETYKEVRVRGDLDRVVSNVKNLIHQRKERGQQEPAVLMRIIQMPKTQHEVDSFLEQWRKNLGPQDGVAVNPYTSWAGLMDEDENGEGEKAPTTATAMAAATVPAAMAARRASGANPDPQKTEQGCETHDHHDHPIPGSVNGNGNGNGNGTNGNGQSATSVATAPAVAKPEVAAAPSTEEEPSYVPGSGDRGACRMLWKNFTVLYDGKVTACCMDAEGELIIGNVHKNSIKEIWQGAPIKKLRDMHKTGDWMKIPICARCKEWI